MDSTLGVAGPSPYKSRRDWLNAFGVIEILMGGAFLLFAIVILWAAGATMPSNAISPPARMVGTALLYGLLAAVFVAGGIGSMLCKNWARIVMLAVSSLWLGFGLMVALILAFIVPAITQQRHGNFPAEGQHAMMVIIFTLVAALGVLLPAIFLFFYSRKSVRATCLAQDAAQFSTPEGGGIAASGLPVPLVILGVWQALGVLSLLTSSMRADPVFGVVLRGMAAFLVVLARAVLDGYAAWAIFRQQLIGWQVALFTTSIWMISGVVTYFRHPDLVQLGREMGYSAHRLRIFEQSPHLLPALWVAVIVVMTAFLVFLLYARRFFPTEEQACPSVPKGQ